MILKVFVVDRGNSTTPNEKVETRRGIRFACKHTQIMIAFLSLWWQLLETLLFLFHPLLAQPKMSQPFIIRQAQPGDEV